VRGSRSREPRGRLACCRQCLRRPCKARSTRVVTKNLRRTDSILQNGTSHGGSSRRLDFFCYIQRGHEVSLFSRNSAPVAMPVPLDFRISFPSSPFVAHFPPSISHPFLLFIYLFFFYFITFLLFFIYFSPSPPLFELRYIAARSMKIARDAHTLFRNTRHPFALLPYGNFTPSFSFALSLQHFIPTIMNPEDKRVLLDSGFILPIFH
jgi:hypothetical protein